MRILITGAGGFVGSHLMDAFERTPRMDRRFRQLPHWAEGRTLAA